MNSKTSELVGKFDAFKNTDKEHAREVWRDIESAIPTCNNSGFKRLWVITNVNAKVLRMLNHRLKKAEWSVDQLGIKIEIFRANIKGEIQLRWKAQNEGIPTLLIQSEVENKVILEL